MQFGGNTKSSVGSHVDCRFHFFEFSRARNTSTVFAIFRHSAMLDSTPSAFEGRAVSLRPLFLGPVSRR